MLELVHAEYVEDHTIEVKFNNGAEGRVDLTEALWGPVFEPLKDPAVFKRFEVSDVIHTIRWENDADLAPEYMYDKMVEQRREGAHG